MQSERNSLRRRVGGALEVVGILGFLVALGSTQWRFWPLSMVPEDGSAIWLIGFAGLGTAGAAMGAKAAKPAAPGE